MCKYCEVMDKQILSEEDEGVICDVYEGYMQVSNKYVEEVDLELSFPINYCPMCGRKFNEKAD